MGEVEQEQEQEKTMGIWEHVGELRNRLFKAAIGFAVTTAIGFAFSDYLVKLLALPIGGIQAMTSIEVTENVNIFMRVSLLAGFILALPWILWQIIGFILPGLLPHEKRWLMIALPTASLLFISGVAFGFFVMMPAALQFLTSFMGIKTQVRPNNYFDFITSLMFWIGVSFETPLLVYVLAKFRLVSARQLARQWRIAVVVIAVIAAVVTPTPDPFNMSLLMIPLLILYGISILLASIARRGEAQESTSATVKDAKIVKPSS